jgi:hypothetical protein
LDRVMLSSVAQRRRTGGRSSLLRSPDLGNFAGWGTTTGTRGNGIRLHHVCTAG